MSVSGFICTVKDPFLFFFHCGHHQHTDWSLEITLSTLGWALKLVSPCCKMVALTLMTASSHNRANQHKNIFCFFLGRVKKFQDLLVNISACLMTKYLSILLFFLINSEMK